MKTMAPTRPAEPRAYRIRLPSGPAAAAKARSQVRAATWARDAAASPDVAARSPAN